MTNYLLKAEAVTKSFGRRLIFKEINFQFDKNGVYGISGPNGSGKSTLVKIIAGVDSPSRGKISHSYNGKEIISEELHNYIGFVSPYLVLYEEFSSWENLTLFSRIRNIKFDKEKVDYLLNKFLLYPRKDDYVKTYSSGMKQRLKFIFALMHSPKITILDEPTSNLDTEGKESVYEIIKELSDNSIVIIASNEDSDLALCSEQIMLEKYKNH